MQDASNAVAPISTLKDIAGHLAVLMAFVYSLGLIVTNIYLWSVNYNDFNLLRPRSILTGAWSGLILAACAAPSYFAISKGSFSGPDWKRNVTTASSIFLLALPCSLGIAVTILLWLKAGDFLPLLWMICEWTAAFTVAMALLRFGTTSNKKDSTNASAEADIFRYSGVVVLAMVALVCVTDLARNVYPGVDSAVGGGKPRPVTLILNSEGASFWKKVTGQATQPQEMAVSGTVYVYHETENQLLLKVCQCIRPDGNFIIMDKKLVAAVVPWARSQPGEPGAVAEHPPEVREPARALAKSPRVSDMH